ncbi:mitochondrial ornithine carrier protein [Monosporozyma unispora]|nr:mitochondrial ornithine carrier protein [Kazachstania unispora]
MSTEEKHHTINNQNSAFKDILNGSIAGACGKLIEYPFDTVKVRLQTQGSKMFPTTWSCIKYTYTNEGILRGFFQGIASPLFGASLENATLFVAYNQTSKYLNKTTQVSELSNIIISGAVAGSFASFVLTPVELIKCKLQVANLENKIPGAVQQTTKIIPTLMNVLKTNGVTGLWQGQSSTFIRESFGGVAWFATYELVKSKLKERHPLDKDNKTWELLVSGASAGLAFNASIFPADTVKSIMQTEHTTIKKAITKIITRYGFKGFYRGLGITLIRAVPANATVFYTYETLSTLEN